MSSDPWSSNAHLSEASEVLFVLVSSSRLMAKLLLEGIVIKKLEKYKESLLSLPLVMIKPWGNLHGERTQILLQQLIENDIENREKLKNALKKDPTFLLNAYLKWIPDSLKPEIKTLWSCLVIE